LSKSISTNNFVLGLVIIVLIAYLTSEIGRKSGPLHPKETTLALIVLIFFQSGIGIKTVKHNNKKIYNDDCFCDRKLFVLGCVDKRISALEIVVDCTISVVDLLATVRQINHRDRYTIGYH
jgi:hypothetical protein